MLLNFEVSLASNAWATYGRFVSENVESLKVRERCSYSYGIVFIVPDTNIWFDKREELFKVLVKALDWCRNFAVIALPHIMINEGLPETYKQAVMSKMNMEICTLRFEQKLMDNVLDAISRGFLVTAAHIPGVYDVARYGLACYVGDYEKRVLDSIVCEYVSKEKGRYYSTLKRSIALVRKLKGAREVEELEVVEREIEKGPCRYEHLAAVLRHTLQRTGNERLKGDRVALEQLRGITKTLLSILADVLIVASCFALAKKSCRPVICVSEDRTLVQALEDMRGLLGVANVRGCGLSELAQILTINLGSSMRPIQGL